MSAPYVVDLDSIVASFPRAIPVPPLLRSFAALVADQPRGALGWFDALRGEPLDENAIGDHDATLRIRERLGLFLALPDGSQVALWRYDDAPADAPAVVLVDSEGEHRTLALTLEAFLLAWSQGKCGVSDLDDGAGGGRSALAEWLAARGIEAPEGKAPTPKLPSFSAWLKAAVEAEAPSPRRVKPALGTPTADSVADLVSRALPLLERLVTEPEVGAFFAELGFDVLGIGKPDVLRDLVLPHLGLEFQIDWPWSGMSKRLDAAYPKPARPELERQKARMFKALEVLPAGYKSWNNGVGGFVTFDAFPGKLPNELSLSDTARP